MTTIEFLAYLRSLDVQLSIEEGRLRCNAPEGVLTPELRAQLSAQKTALVALLQQPHSRPFSATIQPAQRDSFPPLSFAQQRLWFLNQLAPENPFYNVPAALRLSGQLDRVALKQAFNQIVCRHEALRTTFISVDGQPVQVIAPQLSLTLPLVDLQHVPIEEQKAIVQQRAVEEAQRPFHLSTDPLLRVTLLQLEPTEHVLLLTLHHIVSDGWSLGVLIRELGIFYTAFVTNQPAALSALPIQYADFAQWQRQWLQGEVLESQLQYWREQLRDIPMLNLLGDRPRPALQTYRGATEPIQLSHRLTAALEALSQQQGVSLFMTLLAAFQTLLFRYTGQVDITVGSPIANRNRNELEELIGFFVNSLVLRTDLSGNPTFRALLSRVREVALGAYAHQDLPFEKLVEALDPERDLSHNPLFQVAFALQNAPVEPLELPGLTLQPMEYASGTTRFDLEFHLWEPAQGLSRIWQAESEGLTGFVAYSTDLFDRMTIVRMVEHFTTLLEGIVANLDAKLADLPILTASEHQQLIEEWNNTEFEYDKETCFHHQFETQAERYPDTIAVVFENEQLTYRELDQRANQLAHGLQQLGVQPDTLVGLCIDRSLDMMIGILGILKAGGAYVPFDPSYPRERLSFMLADTQVSILLTQSKLANDLPSSQAQIICLDGDQSWLHQQSQKAPSSAVTSENLAYVIYTSGSTGTPKGVLIQHGGLCNFYHAQQQTFNLQPQSRILQFSSINFDASIFEIAMALGAGGTLYIPSNLDRMPGTALAQFLRSHAITHVILPPAVLSVLSTDNLPALQTVISGGEACTSEIIDRWAVNHQFFNAYGPTETTIWATIAQLAPGSSKPTIGRPIANTQVYILDIHRQPVPIGVAGELYIGGDGLARGYLNRPELTAERFVSHPFQAGSSLYRTGDLARYRADGNIEFLGRVDDQVKIRGFRVELGEIEAVLSQHPAVRETIVLAQGESEHKRLAAYFTLNLQHRDQTRLEQALEEQQIEQWQTLYNQTYADDGGDPTFNITGWNSSYTGQPIPSEQMHEWVKYRVQQILSFKPSRVLEIGCGTGLLLFSIAPHCSQYWATDFSSVSLNSIQQQLTKQELSHVKLLHKMAHDFDDVEPAAFDAVILNSVVQYFPSLNYLLQVLEGAVKAIAPGGFIFIGDVRSLPLLTAFHASVQLHQADGALDRTQLRQRVQRSQFEETELVIDPALFHALRDRFPQIDQVQIHLSRGRHHNEMTQFRYNVVLHIKTGSWQRNNSVDPGSTAATQIDWSQHQLSVLDVVQYVSQHEPDILFVTGIPNARVITAVRSAEWLFDADAPKTAGRMQAALANLTEAAIDPQAWWDLETEMPYRVEVSWSRSNSEGRYDVLFVRQGVTVLPFDPVIDYERSWKTYTNQPLQAQLARQLVPQLRSHLAQQLPEYMVPAAFVALEQLPLTPNGKVDRRALPTPDRPDSIRVAGPRSPVEATLVAIWTELLRLKQVGVHDNFFELGGHSLLATQLGSRVRDAFGIEVPLRTLFEGPTIAQLASVIQSLQDSNAQKQAPALVKLDRASHRKLRSSLTHEIKE